MNPSTLLVRFSMVFLICLLAAGCEEDLGLRDEFPEPFTLYGLLSPQLDTQSVRVYSLEAFPNVAFDDGISFLSTDLVTGEQLVWQDSVVTKPNGQQDLVFWAPFRPKFNRSYRVEAIRQSDGASSYAEVRIPPPVLVRLEEPFSPEINEVFVNVLIEGPDIRALNPEIVYRVFTEGNRELKILRTYHRSEHPTENGWMFTFNFYVERLWVQSFYNQLAPDMTGIRCQAVNLVEMELHLIVGDSAWDPPEGNLDPNLLSHPQALTNVENGLGFVGGGYRIAEPLMPSRETVEKACFKYAL